MLIQKREIKDRIRGVFLAFGSAAGYSAVFIVGNIAQRNLPTEQFVFWWFFIASLIGSLLWIKKSNRIEFLKSLKAHLGFFLYFGVSEALATFTFFYLIKILNPAFVSFVVNLSPVFVVFWGYVLLRERLNFAEAMGAAVAMTGVVIISYASPEVNFWQLLVILLMTLTFAFNTVLVKYKVKNLSPLYITIFRIYALFGLFSIHNLHRGFVFPEPSTFVLIFFGALLGPLGATFCLFSSLKYLKASSVSIIKSVQPFLVVLGAYSFLDRSLSGFQVFGGILTVVGVNVLILGSRSIGKRRVLSPEASSK